MLVEDVRKALRERLVEEQNQENWGIRARRLEGRA